MNLHRTEFCFSKITAHESGFKTLFELIPDPPSELWIQGSEKALRLLDLLPDRGLALSLQMLDDRTRVGKRCKGRNVVQAGMLVEAEWVRRGQKPLVDRFERHREL